MKRATFVQSTKIFGTQMSMAPMPGHEKTISIEEGQGFITVKQKGNIKSHKVFNSSVLHIEVDGIPVVDEAQAAGPAPQPATQVSEPKHGKKKTAA